MKMKTLEVFGPAGSGKSTIVRHLAMTNKSGRRYQDSKVVSFSPLQSRPLRVLLSGLMRSRFRIIHGIGIKASRSLEPRLRQIVFNKEWPEEWTQFYEWAWRKTGCTKDPKVASGKSILLAHSFANAYFCHHESRGDKCFLIDEGLLQRGLSLATMEEDIDMILVTEYFSRVPLPDGAVVIKSKPEIISKRLVQRNMTAVPIQHHIDTTGLSIRAADLAHSVLARRGLNIIALSNDKHPSEAIRDIVAHFG